MILRPRLAPLLLPILLLLGAAAHATPGKAHEHGAATLDVAVESGHLTVLLDSPLDNLLGFEHAPSTPAERQRVAALVAQLKAADRLLRIDDAAGCTLETVRLEAPVVGVNVDTAGSPAAATTPAKPDEGHGDLDAEFSFACAHADQASHIALDALWSAFPGLQRLDAQIATTHGQARRTLRRPQARLPLAR